MIWVQIVVQLAIAVVLTIASLLLAPKPAKQKPPEFEEIKTPTSQQGIPVPVIFGTVIMQSPNVLARADRYARFYDF